MYVFVFMYLCIMYLCIFVFVLYIGCGDREMGAGNGDGEGGPARHPFVLLDAAQTRAFSQLKRARQAGALCVTGNYANFLIWLILLVAV